MESIFVVTQEICNDDLEKSDKLRRNMVEVTGLAN
jgi:hypothetical protein